MKKFKIYALSLLFAGATLSSCTDLDEKMYSVLEDGVDGGINPAELLISAYDALNGQHQVNNVGARWGLNEVSTDAAIFPTRGGDWDAGGMHRDIHMHNWNADNPYMDVGFSRLHTAQFRADNVIAAAGAEAGQKAEARFIRALCMYDVLNLWGFILQRKDLQDIWENPAVVPAKEAVDFIRQELEALIVDPNMPEFDKTKAYIASKDAARFLLMKLHLNKGAFLNRESPGFAPEDMNRVLVLAAQIRASGKLALAGESAGTVEEKGREYFDNFAPNNEEIAKENIYTLLNSADRGGAMTSVWNNTAHYNMDPSGWNGVTTLKNFYESYDAGDVRRGMAYNGYPGQGTRTNPGNRTNVGFFAGQQYNLTTGAELMARNPAGAKLVFVPEISLRTSGATLETAGVRVHKYPYDYESYDKNQNPSNDWAVFRYADLLLMEAEALLRTNREPEARTIVNAVRAARNAGAPFAVLTEENLLAERGRELYWEGWRREDLIRFGKFLEPNEIRIAKSPAHRLLFAVPSQQLAVNPNLKQNPGY